MQHTEEEIFEHTRSLMVELFELDSEQISMDAKLADDLDIDSIDAVDLMVELKKYTGSKIDQEAFREVRSIADVVRVIHGMMNSSAA